MSLVNSTSGWKRFLHTDDPTVPRCVVWQNTYTNGRVAAHVEGRGTGESEAWIWKVSPPSVRNLPTLPYATGQVSVAGHVGLETAIALCDVLLGHEPKHAYTVTRTGQEPEVHRGPTVAHVRTYVAKRHKIDITNGRLLKVRRAMPGEVRFALGGIDA